MDCLMLSIEKPTPCPSLKGRECWLFNSLTIYYLCNKLQIIVGVSALEHESQLLLSVLVAFGQDELADIGVVGIGVDITDSVVNEFVGQVFGTQPHDDLQSSPRLKSDFVVNERPAVACVVDIGLLLQFVDNCVGLFGCCPESAEKHTDLVRASFGGGTVTLCTREERNGVNGKIVHE